MLNGFNSGFAPCKGIQDSLGFWIPRHGFRILGTGFQSLQVKLGFWIPIVSRIPDSLSCFADSKTRDSGFHKQTFPGLGLSGLKAPTRDAGCRKRQPSGRDDGIGPLFNGHIDFQIWAELGLGLGLARNFLLQSSAKLTTGIPRANQKPVYWID